MTLESNAPIAHGGALSEAIAQYGGSASEWLDLSTGISPFSLPLPELPTDCWRRLPERAEIERVCELAKRHYGASVVPVAVPGTQAAIQLLPFLTPNASEVAIVSPTYGEYARAYQRMDVAVDPWTRWTPRPARAPVLQFWQIPTIRTAGRRPATMSSASCGHTGIAW
jgi:cobalamin biosynthetic protein CobC